MSGLCYCQYAFAQPQCRVQEIGPGVDPRYQVELIRDGSIAALTSRVGLDQFAPDWLQGTTASDVRWLAKIAARHNEIICHAAISSAVLPLRLGAMFQSREAVQAMLAHCQSTVAEFLEQLGNRQEWEVKLYLEKPRPKPIPEHTGPPSPHYLAKTNPFAGGETLSAGQPRNEHIDQSPPTSPGTTHVTPKNAHVASRRKLRANVHHTVHTVEHLLAGGAERICRIRSPSSDLTGRTEQVVFNAAFLLSSSSQATWLDTVQDVCRDIHSQGLVLEVSGPWPPYHFCPSLDV